MYRNHTIFLTLWNFGIVVVNIQNRVECQYIVVSLPLLLSTSKWIVCFEIDNPVLKETSKISMLIFNLPKKVLFT